MCIRDRYFPSIGKTKHGLLERILRSASESELRDVLKVSEGRDQVFFNFFYAGRDNLSDSVKGDGFCSIRNAMILEQGKYFLCIHTVALSN